MKQIYIAPIIIASLIFALFLIRLISPREIDDVSPEIPCEEYLLQKSDILWVIPNFNNTPISENRVWLQKILALNKTLGLHGVYHTYKEFNTNRNQGYLQEGISEFEKSFNQTPTMFKPPQLKINKENKILLKNNNLELKDYSNQIFHKVYHCNNTGRFPNWFIDLF